MGVGVGSGVGSGVSEGSDTAWDTGSDCNVSDSEEKGSTGRLFTLASPLPQPQHPAAIKAITVSQ